MHMYVYICILSFYVYVLCMYVHMHTCVEVRGQLAGVGSLLRLWGLDAGHQAQGHESASSNPRGGSLC